MSKLVGSGSGEAMDFSSLKFFEGIEDCYLGTNMNNADIILPYANGIEGGDDDLEACAGIMRKSQAKKLDNFYIQDNVLYYGGMKYSLQPLHTIVSLSYLGLNFKSINAGTASSKNGTTSLSYTYEQTKKVTYDDGSVETSSVVSGATIDNIEINSEYLDHIEGNVIYWKDNTLTAQRSMTVSVTLSLNGETQTKTTTIWQNAAAAAPVKFYIGQASGRADEFVELSAEALVSGAISRNISDGTKMGDGVYMHSTPNINIIYYVMYPIEKSELVGATLRAQISSPFTADDINDIAVWKAGHSNVEIGGVTYAVRGYRNTSLPGTAMELTIKQK